MIILVDTREQRPLHFSGDVQTRRATLAVGDYSIAGLEDVVTVERKSLPDLLGCIGRDRERFIRELRQLRAYRFAGLVVEARWPDLLTGIWGAPSQVHPNAVIGSLMSFAAKYGVVPILADDHTTAGILVERLLITFARMVEKEFKALREGGLDTLDRSQARVEAPAERLVTSTITAEATPMGGQAA